MLFIVGSCEQLKTCSSSWGLGVRGLNACLSLYRLAYLRKLWSGSG